MPKLRSLLQKDISRRAFWLLLAAAAFLRVFLCSFQLVYTWIDGAPLDDELMFGWAQSITAGEWLGPYNYLTLSKRPLFAVWLALLHTLHLPYLVMGQVLWCLAALAAMLAFAPVLKKRYCRLLLFILVCFDPATAASYTLRVYRDNIYPALCLLMFAGFVGWLLRIHGPIKKNIGWLLLGGLGLGTEYLCREDGSWVLPFAAFFTLVGLVLIIRGGTKQKLLRLPAALLPYIILAASVLTLSAVNASYYGVFTVSDFSSGSFADAMGAMNRVKENTKVQLVSVPTEVRLALYDNVEELQPLRYWLEEDADLQNSFRNPVLDDYQSGSFYWAIRRAAQNEGIYDTPQKADAYWTAVAEKINRLCDEGKLPSEGKRRSGTTPPVRAEDIPAVLSECFKSLAYVLTFGGCEPYYSERTIGTAEDLAVWEEYLHTGTNVAAAAGTDTPYYNPLRKCAYLGLQLIRYLWTVFLPLLFAAGILLWLKAGLSLLRSRKDGLLWLICLGLLGAAAVRIGMISFMEAVSFHIGTSVMYLSTVHPLLLLFGGIVCLTYLEQHEGAQNIAP